MEKKITNYSFTHISSSPFHLENHANLSPIFSLLVLPLLVVSIIISLPYVNTTLATHNATW